MEHRKVTNRYAPYNEEHKRVLKHMPGRKAIAECKRRALILAMGIYLALDGKWTQRNWNIVGFGASGAGKTRFFIIPNILQFDGCYIVVDPSGELEQKLGGGLEANGYIIKRFSTDDMTKSNRFNPLFYIRKTSDILIVVNTLIEIHRRVPERLAGMEISGERQVRLYYVRLSDIWWRYCRLSSETFLMYWRFCV